MSRIVYLTTARLPTEKAHGYQICKMCEAFAMAGHEVTLVHPFRNQPGPLREQTIFSYYGVRQCFSLQTLVNADIFRFEQAMPAALFRLLFLVHALVWALYAVCKARAYNADLYYTRDVPLAFWLTQFGMPTVLELHTVPAGAQRIFLKRACARKSLKQIASLTTFIKQRLVAHGVPAEKVFVLPDAVDLDMFSIDDSKEQCRQRLGLPPDAFIVGYIGRFTTMGMEKGVRELMEEFALVRVQNRSVLLVCVGASEQEMDHYSRAVTDCDVNAGSIKIIRSINYVDVPLWLRAFDIAVAPFPNIEHYAYFMSPLKIFEYMASGVPIVASDLPSLREVLRHGENAWLVQPGDPGALAAGISHVLSMPDLGERIARQALQDVKQYTWQKRAERVVREA